MKLNIQINTLLVSILFGIYFCLILDIFKKILLKNKILQFILSFIIVLFNSIIYFLILLKLNNAILHPYYIIALLIGFLIENVIFKTFKRIVKKYKRWYNSFGG
jgi:hypothetical protein